MTGEGCSKCGQELSLEKLMPIETDTTTYYYCTSCLTEASKALSMRLFKNKEQRKLLKDIRKFLKHEKN